MKVNNSIKKQIVLILSSLALMVAIGLSIDMYLTHKEIMEASNACYNRNGYPIVHKEGFVPKWSFTCNGI